MHTHVSALDALVVLLYLVILGALARVVQAKLIVSDNPTVSAAGGGLSFLA